MGSSWKGETMGKVKQFNYLFQSNYLPFSKGETISPDFVVFGTPFQHCFTSIIQFFLGGASRRRENIDFFSAALRAAGNPVKVPPAVLCAAAYPRM